MLERLVWLTKNSDVDDLDINKLLGLKLSKWFNKNDVAERTAAYDELVKKKKNVNAIQAIHIDDVVYCDAYYHNKIEHIDQKIPNHDKYISANELIKLTKEFCRTIKTIKFNKQK